MVCQHTWLNKQVTRRLNMSRVWKLTKQENANCLKKKNFIKNSISKETQKEEKHIGLTRLPLTLYDLH